jgi:outer membrane protein TolC
MMRPLPYLRGRLGCASLAAVLAGCATVTADEATDAARERAIRETGQPVALATSQAERDAIGVKVDQWLAAPLGADDAVRLALAKSPALQALLAEGWAAQAAAEQAGRIPNPRFAFERLVRGDEVELGRAISFGLLDVLTLPLRREPARRAVQAEQLRLAAQVLEAAHEARRQWVQAVAAKQRLAYQRQVLDAAEAGAELARRMQAVGNFSRLQRARQQMFEAEAKQQLARAQVQAAAEREALVRRLGLDAAQAERLQLPERLPDLPAAPRDAADVAAAAGEQRLDLQIAQLQWQRAGGNASLVRATSWSDIELKAMRNSETGLLPQRGWEIEIALPLFDLGDARRAAASAGEIAALNRLEQTQIDAGSVLRERYAAHRVAWDLARQHRDEVVPLAKLVSEEMVLRYNGMLSGVFELLADARSYAATVIAALDAQRDFWIADAALQAAVIGVATPGAALSAGSIAAASGEEH